MGGNNLSVPVMVNFPVLRLTSTRVALDAAPQAWLLWSGMCAPPDVTSASTSAPPGGYEAPTSAYLSPHSSAEKPCSFTFLLAAETRLISFLVIMATSALAFT